MECKTTEGLIRGHAGTAPQEPPKNAATARHILLVEDDRDHANLILRAFRNDPDLFRISVAGSLRKAREILAGDPPDLIIADYNLPDGKGIEVLPREDGRVTLPLVVMTGFGNETLAVEIMKSGAIDYVVKSATVFADMPTIARKAFRFWENIRERERAETEARNLQKRLVDILAFLPDPMLAIDATGTVIAWNRAMEELTGVSASAMIGKGDHEYSVPFYGERRPILADLVLADDPETEKKYLYVRCDGEKIISETHIPELNGRKDIDLWGTAAPLVDAAGACIGAVEVIRDITERKRTEEALRESESRLRLFISQAPAALAMFDREMRYLAASHRWITDFHLGGQEIIGRSHYDVFPELREEIREAHRRGLAGEVVRSDEDRFTRADGTEDWLSWEVRPWYAAGQAIGGIIIFSENITERKNAEEQLRDSEEKYRAVVENSGAGIIVIDRDGTYLFANSRVASAMGARPEEVIGKTMADFLPEETARRYLEKNREVMDTGEGCEYEDTFELKSGRRSFWIIDTCLKDADGHCFALQSSSVDITDRKEAEEKLRKSEERYRLLFERAPVGITHFDSRGVVTECNEHLAEIIGAPREKIIGVDMPAAFANEQQKAALARALRGSPGYFEGNYTSVTGKKTAVIRTVYTPILDNRGSVTGGMSITEDISERKRTEDALRKNEIQLGAAMDLAHMVSWELDVPTGIFTFNDRFYALYGTTAGQEGGYTMPAEEYARRFIPPEEQAMVEEETRKAVETDDPHYIAQIEHRIIRRNGEIRSILVRYSVVKDAGGRTVKTYGANQDITDRKRAEEALQESEQRYRSVVENAAEGITVVQDGAFQYANSRLLEMAGAGPDGLTGRLFEEFIHPDDREAVLDRHRHRLDGESVPQNYDFRVIGRDGAVLWVQIAAVRILWKGRPATLNFLTDITGRKQAEEALRVSEEKFRTVANYTYDWEYWILPDKSFRFISPSCEAVTGYTAEEFTRDPEILTRIVHPDDRQKFLDHMETTGTESRAPFEFRIIGKSGNTVWLGHTCRPLFGPDGNYIGRRASNRDITKRKEAEMTLMESETRFRALIQNSSDIIRILDRDGRIVYESPSADRILGFPPGFLIGRDPMEYIHPEDRERVAGELRTVIDRVNTGVPTEFRIRTADGTYVWVDSIGTNLLDTPGVNGIVITTRTIQQRKQAEQARYESEERLRLAMEGADAAFWDWNLITGNAVFSDRFYTMLDEEPGAFPATYEAWTARIHPDDHDRVLLNLDQQIRERRPLCEIEYRLRAHEGNWIWILGRGKIVEYDDRGNPARMTGVNIDVTSRRMLESEIRSLNTVLEQRVKERTEELARTNDALEEENAQRVDAEAKLRASLEEKTMLLKEIHHRVKNNLQIITSLLNLQSRFIRDEQTLAAIRESQNRVRAMALVHEKLYRTEDITHIDLADYVKFLGTGLFQFYDARSRGIRFDLKISDTKVDINAAIPLGLIINELISNSLKYAFPEGRTGEVSVEVIRESHGLKIVYRDDGIGIPPDLDWQNTQSLGLRLVNSLVDQMNGTIGLDRSAGTRFTIMIPDKD